VPAPRPLAVLDVVGLTPSLLGDHAPNLQRLAAAGTVRPIRTVLPAVTCPVQSTMLTGRPPSEHGIVGNGWYERDAAEVRFWRQSNALVRGPKVWDALRDRAPEVTVANCFWWFNMHARVDLAVTPRPMYPADGRKIPDVYTDPPALRDRLQQRHGRFPLFRFWGPAASIESTRWITSAAIDLARDHRPTLLLVYLPHLDYGLQKLGPDHPAIPDHVATVDEQVGRLLEAFEATCHRTMVVSEYGIEPVTAASFPNLALRDAGLLRWREELGREVLDPGGSRAFAVADHQVAHVHGRTPEDVEAAGTALAGLDGVERILAGEERAAAGLDHERAGDLVLVAERGRWFAHDWWHDDARAPDYQRTVDIHRKPGYDPRELFIDPAFTRPRIAVGRRLLMRTLGFRRLLDVIPTDTALVRGSHGRVEMAPGRDPVLITPVPMDDLPAVVEASAVHDLMLRLILEDR